MPKLTSKPAHYECVTSDHFARGILDLEQRSGSIDYVPFGIKNFTLVLLFVDTNDLCEVVCFLL